MKTKFILFIFSIVLSNSLFAQSKARVCYSYDKAGNRTNRIICVPVKSSETITDSVSIAKTTIAENPGEMVITLYPNPTKGQLTVKIANMPVNTQGELTLHDLTGRLIIRQNSIQESTLLDISVKPLGIYVLCIRVGDKVSEWKVIKE